jgi:hypothetical protein
LTLQHRLLTPRADGLLLLLLLLILLAAVTSIRWMIDSFTWALCETGHDSRTQGRKNNTALWKELRKNWQFIVQQM